MWIVALALVALSGPALLQIASRAGGATFVQQRIRYLSAALALAVAVWLVALVTAGTPDGISLVGDLSAETSGLGWLGVGDGETWGRLLITLGGMITLITAAVVWMQLARPAGLRLRALPRALPLALVFAVINATAEELIFRVALITSLDPMVGDGHIGAAAVALISAALFGLPHFAGSPGGPVGVLMSGFLGWLACTSVFQTGGIVWALSLHVALDVVIFTIMIALSRSVVPALVREADGQPDSSAVS